MKRILFSVFMLMFLIAIPNVSTKSYGWGFKRNSENKPPEVGFYANEIDGTSSFYIGDTSKKTVYLTFDAGYDNGYMSGILKTLREKNVKSTFFVTGDFVTRESELLKKIVEDGHIVGNHTWGHKDITTLTEDELANELVKVEEKYYELTGEEIQKYFRPPEGTFNKESLMMVKKLGYTTFFWSVAFKDWEDLNRGKDLAYKSIVENLHNGAIILMHTVSQDNVDALPMIIDSIREEGYTIENLDDLMNSKEFPFEFYYNLP